MSRLYEALRRLELVNQRPGTVPSDPARPADLLNNLMTPQAAIEETHSVKLNLPAESRLVALTDPKGLGAEKFRALVLRLENLRHQHELKSFQVTSSVGGEGKSLVSANLAVTLALNTRSKVLLVEGDLHRPTLSTLFGLNDLKGVSDWWSGIDERFASFLYQLNDMPLWLLCAGHADDHPSDILQSARFAGAFTSLASSFDWIIVDSTPMQPIVDVNLWSRLVDATILVVREGVAPIEALKKGLEGLDNLKLVGVILNEASESRPSRYGYSYYGRKKGEKKPS
jgi:capsular exopolysaccharide synthesis family protein